MATKQQIINRALIRVGALDPMQTPTSTQSDQVDTVLVSLHKWLVDEEDVTWQLSLIPESMEEPLVSRLAFAITNDFGVSDSRYQRLSVANNKSIKEMQKYNAVPYSVSSEIESY